MFNLILILALCGGCHHSNSLESQPQPVVAQSADVCKCGPDCKCGAGKHCCCENCKYDKCHKNHKLIMKVSGVNVHVIPMDDGIILDFDSDKTLPVDVSYQKNKSGGYRVTMIVRDKSIVKKTKVPKLGKCK